MSSLERPLSGEVLVFHLDEERPRAADPAALARGGRNARTLLKAGPLRVTLVALAPGGETGEHEAQGPITVQPVEGAIRFSAHGRDHDLRPGDLLSAGPGIRHRVSSAAGGVFLLTVAQQPGGG